MKIIVYILFTVRYSDCVETMNHKQRQDEMKTKNLIKAIEKTGLKVEVNGNWYIVKGPRNYGKFCDQDGQAVCVSTCDNNESSQPEIDYFPQWYHETIKSFIADLTKPARNEQKTISTWVDSRGFVVESTNAMDFDSHNKGFPSQKLWEQNGVYIQKSYIQQTERSHKIIYFVSGTNGDEFGQFPNEQLAKEKAVKMAALTQNERKQFDQ